MYNAPTQLLDTLKELNVSAVATATDHAMDKREKGVINTINNLIGYITALFQKLE